MSSSTRVHEPDADPNKKKIKICYNNEDLLPSVIELPDDILDYIIANFLGASSLLNLAMTCSKLSTIINSQHKRIMRNIFPCRLDATAEVREQIQNELKDIAKIEKAFNYYNVRVIEVDGDQDRIKRTTVFKTFPGDPSRLLCLTNANRVAQLIEMAIGNIYVVDMNQEVHDAAISSEQHVAFLSPLGVVQIYSISNLTHWTQVCTFDTCLQGAKITWMRTQRYWIVYTESGSNYQLYDPSGKLIKKVHYGRSSVSRLLAVSEDGTDAVRLLYRPYNRGTFSRVDLLTDDTTCLIEDTGEAEDDYINLKFLTYTDWVVWQRTGTDAMALFMYNIKTGERFWTPTSAGPKLSYAGTMLMTNTSQKIVVQDLYSDQEYAIKFADDIVCSAWTYLPHAEGAATERIVARLMDYDKNSAISIIDPIAGTALAQVYQREHSDTVCWQLVHVLAEGRTLVFRDKFAGTGYIMIWNLH